MTFDLQALRLGGGAQACSLWRLPEMVGDPVETGGGDFLQLRFNGKVALSTVILHGPQGLKYQEFTHVRASADV
ncbi:hypothetical protein D3C75_1254090 [compost metagenome]